MRKLLESKGIPISSFVRDRDSSSRDRATYKGSSDSVGKYKIRLRKPAQGGYEEISLRSKRKSAHEYGEMQKLVDCVIEYLAFYEADKEAKIRALKARAPRPSEDEESPNRI